MHKVAVLAFACLMGIAIPAATATDGDIVDLQSIIDAADPGSTITLDAGTYAGGVHIDKALTITGEKGAVIDGGGQGTLIEVTAPDVTIEGLTLRASGASLDREDSGVSVLAPRVTIRNNTFDDVLFGVFLRKAPDSVVANNVFGAKDVFIANRGDGIRLWESERSLVENNVIHGGRDTVFWFTDEVVVRNNEVTDGRYGLHFMYSDGAIVEGNVLSDNSVGAFMMYSRDVTIRNNIMAENHGPSGYGIGFKDMDRVTADGNRFIGNRVGMYFDNTPYTHNEHEYITGNLIAYNKVGVLLQPSVKRNIFSGNAFIDNTEQVGVSGSGEFSGNEWSMDGVGNYWSDFAGYDADGNGVGDVSYRVDDLYNTLTDKHPNLQFYQDTPAAKAIALAAEMFPVLKPRPILEDEFPLTERPVMASVRTDTSGTTALAFVSVAMVIGAAAAVVIPSRRRRSHGAKEMTV
jgi:nitrous oxidase accessory protein